MTPIPAPMRAIDELAQLIRRAVQMRRREQIDAVVAPPEPPLELGDRHQLDHGDTERCQLCDLRSGGRPGAGPGECSGVQLVDHLTAAQDPWPCRIGPPERRRVDNGRRTVRTVGLVSGCRDRDRASRRHPACIDTDRLDGHSRRPRSIRRPRRQASSSPARRPGRRPPPRGSQPAPRRGSACDSASSGSAPIARRRRGPGTGRLLCWESRGPVIVVRNESEAPANRVPD